MDSTHLHEHHPTSPGYESVSSYTAANSTTTYFGNRESQQARGSSSTFSSSGAREQGSEQKLQGQVLNHVSAMPTSHPTATSTSSKPVTKTSHGSTAGAPSFSQATTATAHKPTTDKRNDRKCLAAGCVFTYTAIKGEQGYRYVYIGRSRKIQRSKVRTHLKSAQVDLGRVLDICFPASQVIGVLLHVQYIQEFTELIKMVKGELYTDFDPLNPYNIADPKYASPSDNERHALIHQFTEARCLQTLSFLRPLNVSGIGKYFVEEGRIDSADLSSAAAAAMDRLAEKEPKKAAFMFRRKLGHAKTAASDSDMSDLEN